MIPYQERGVDPYSSYESNKVNRLTRAFTLNGLGCICRSDYFVPSKHSSTILRVTPGVAIQNDVVIHVFGTLVEGVRQNYIELDITDILNYTDQTYQNSVSINTCSYLVLKYQYIRKREPEVAELLIMNSTELFQPLSPSYVGEDLDFPYIFLGKINWVSAPGVPGYSIDSVEMFDDINENGKEDSGIDVLRRYAGFGVNYTRQQLMDLFRQQIDLEYVTVNHDVPNGQYYFTVSHDSITNGYVPMTVIEKETEFSTEWYEIFPAAIKKISFTETTIYLSDTEYADETDVKTRIRLLI